MSRINEYIEARQIGNMDIGPLPSKGNGSKQKCSYCGDIFTYHMNRVVYKINKIFFCSWTCKCRWRRENDKS